MSARSVVWCDQSGCDAEVVNHTMPLDRSAMALLGWVRLYPPDEAVPGSVPMDFCPQHATRDQRETTPVRSTEEKPHEA